MDTDRRTPEWFEIAVLTLVLVGLAVLFGFGLYQAAIAQVRQCATAVPATSPIGPTLALTALGSFVVGRVVAYVRKWIHQAPPVTESKVVRIDGWLQGLLAAFLVLVALALLYETYGVANFAQAPPITEYVRCAAGSQPWLTGLGTAAVFVLVGNWLWYPNK